VSARIVAAIWPGQPPGKRGVATAGDLWLGFGPGNFSATPRDQRFDGEFRRFEGMDMPLPVTGGIMVMASPMQQFARATAGMAAAKARRRHKTSLHQIPPQPAAGATANDWSAQQFTPVLRPAAFAWASAEQSADVYQAAVDPA